MNPPRKAGRGRKKQKQRRKPGIQRKERERKAETKKAWKELRDKRRKSKGE
jgi:hypothetical protein